MRLNKQFLPLILGQLLVEQLKDNVYNVVIDWLACGIDPKKVNVEFNGTAMTGGNPNGQTTPMREHRIITKKQLQANRLRYLKENSEVLSLNNFMKKLH